MRRRDVIGLSLCALLAIPAIGVRRPRVPLPRMFALVYVKGTKEVRRLIDTSADVDDSHLWRAHAVLAADETMELFPQHAFVPTESDFGFIRWPRHVAPYIGTGIIV